MSRIEKTIARQKEKIEEGQFYEAHQQLRVIASRYLKSEAYDSAISVLSSGANLLLKAGQGGSGGDLCIFLMEVYNKAEVKPDAEAKGRLLTLLRAFPPGESTVKRFVGEMVTWSAKYGDFPAGDPEIHHVAGVLFAEEGEPYDAERHLVLGTKDSPPHLARLEYDWYTQSDSPSTAPLYAARAIFPLLLVRNLRGANAALLIFTSRLAQSYPGGSLAVTEISGAEAEMRVYGSLPLLNFLALLLLAVQKGQVELWRQLMAHYKGALAELEGAWDEALEGVGEMYFGVKKPRQSNPLFDMMGSMFGGGGGGGGGAAKPAVKNKSPASLAAPGID